MKYLIFTFLLLFVFLGCQKEIEPVKTQTPVAVDKTVKKQDIAQNNGNRVSAYSTDSAVLSSQMKDPIIKNSVKKPPETKEVKIKNPIIKKLDAVHIKAKTKPK